MTPDPPNFMKTKLRGNIWFGIAKELNLKNGK